MAEMNLVTVQANRKKKLAVDADSFAAEIEDHANTLAESGWAHEATNLRKWASELKRGTLRADYTGSKRPK